MNKLIQAIGPRELNSKDFQSLRELGNLVDSYKKVNSKVFESRGFSESDESECEQSEET